MNCSEHRNLSVGETYFVEIGEHTLATGFFDDACRRFYQRRLLQCHGVFRIDLHAYYLARDEVVLLITPHTPRGFFSFLHFINNCYDQYYWTRFERRVKVWQKRPRVKLVKGLREVLTLQKYVERLSLKCEDISHPGETSFSSYCANAFCVKPESLSPHSAYRSLTGSRATHLSNYRSYVASEFTVEQNKFLMKTLDNNKVIKENTDSIYLEKQSALTDIVKSGTICETSRFKGAQESFTIFRKVPRTPLL